MNTTLRRTVCICFLAAAFLAVSSLPAEAARFGGGRSFGGQSMQRAAPPVRPAAPAREPARQNLQQQNAARNTAAAPAMAPRGGGFLGGMLAGSLLGMLLFGGPYSGFGLADMALVALLAFGAFMLFRAILRRKAAPAGSGAESPGAVPLRSPAQPVDPVDSTFRSTTPSPASDPNPWARLRGSENASAAGSGALAPDAPMQREDFDAEDFLKGARVLYTRLQAAWDRRDLDDIGQFATPAVVEEIRKQTAADPGPSHTDILLVNADLLSLNTEGATEVAEVSFDVLLREHPEEEKTTQVREIWYFVRPLSGGFWQVDGIRQVD